MTYYLHVKIQLFVTAKSYQDTDADPDPHWFGPLDPGPDPHWGKKLDPDPR